MPAKPLRKCTTPGCVEMAAAGRCERCRRRRVNMDSARHGSPAELGYGRIWRARRLDYLAAHRWCVLCGRAATIPDHYPLSRKQLVALGVADPDADERLRPLCDPCHRRETARLQPGGWHQEMHGRA